MMDSFYKLVGVSCLFFLFVQHESAAHSPHHVITEVAVSPGDKAQSEVFILITDQIFKSDHNGLSWKILENGLTNQFPFTSIEFSPRYELDGTLFASTSGDGVFWSRDRGNSWSSINAGLLDKNISNISVASFGDNQLRILAASENGGAWQYTSEANAWQLALTESVHVQDFVEVLDSDGMPITIAGSVDGRLWHSSDNGRLWALVSEEPVFQSITSLGGNLDSLFVGTADRGLFRSTDGGISFDHLDQLKSVRTSDCRGNQLEQPVDDLHIAAINVSSFHDEPSRTFVTTWFNGVFVSDDNGSSWSIWNSGLSCDPQANAMHASHYRNVAVSRFASSTAVHWVAAFDGLFRGEGDDPDWDQRETLPVGLIKGLGTSLGRDGSTAIGLSTYGGGFYLTEDNGASWTIGNRGLRTTRLTGLSFSNNFPDDGVIYGGTSRSLLKSTDFGRSWAPIRLREPAFGTRVANKLTNWGLPRSWFGSAAAAPPAMMFPTQIVQPPGNPQGQVLFGTRSHGVVAYNELSESVESLWSGTDKVINNLLMSPNFNADSMLISSIRGVGLMRSDDGGFNWHTINKGLSFVRKWRENPSGADFRRDVLVALSPSFQRDRTLFAGSPAGDGLYVSRDRGSNWIRLSQTDEPYGAILALALSPNFERDRMLVISVKGRGLFRSDDAGKSFTSVGTELLEYNFPIELLAFSSTEAEFLSLVAASDEQLFISNDYGDSWALIRRPIRYEDMREPVRFSGMPDVRRNADYSAQTETLLSQENDRVQLDFVGDGIRWLGSEGPSFGKARVSIDGEFVEVVDSHADAVASMRERFVTRGLGFGPHTIEIFHDDNSDKNVAIDAFDVLPAPTTSN